MIGTKRSWTGRAAMAAIAVGLVWATSGAMAAPAAEIIDAGVIVPSAKSLMRFYPAQLSSTPAGVVEDQEVWLAKVQGLMAGAPSLLQQSLLMSQTRQEFSANVTLLQQLQTGSIKQSGMDLRTQAKAGLMAAKALGSSTNLVYKEVEPCRIMDTRSASGASGVQGPILGNNEYFIPGYITTGSNWGSFGQPVPLSDCGLNDTYGGSIWAVAIVITILNPNFDAYLGVDDSSTLATTLKHVALNFTHGQGLSTMFIVPQESNTISFAMPTGLSAQIIFDVVGFFHVSDATALDCVTTAENSAVMNVSTGVADPGFFNSVTAPACGAGYTETATYCRGGFVNDWIAVEQIGGSCYGNTNDNTHTIKASRRCCRVPGR